MTRLVLASASPARLAVLRSAGVEPVVRVSGVDEDALAGQLGPDAAPQTVVTELARAKALFVAGELAAAADGVCWLDGVDPPALAADCVVVGCDSMLHIGGELQGKPHTPEAARARWAAMMGRSGDLLTGHCVLRMRDGAVIAQAGGCSTTTVHFGDPSADDLEAYLASGEPLAVAGAFTLDGLGGWFVDRIEGDPSSVIGIGLPLVRRLVEEVGVSVAGLWAASPRY